MNWSDVWDWSFMWQMSRNFTATVSPFVMIITAVCVAGMVTAFIVAIVRGKKNG